MNQESLNRMFYAEFELCEVQPNESVVVVSGAASDPRYVEASVTAAQDHGARVFELTLPPADAAAGSGASKGARPIPGRPLSHLPLAVETLKKADMVIDHHFILHSPEQEEILKAGTRMLLILEPPEILARLFPTKDHRRRIELGADLLRNAKELRLTSESGTHLTAPITQYPVITQYGYTDQPGRWDAWPGTFLYTWPNEGAAQGAVVFDTGDVLLPLQRYVEQPVTLHIENGFVRAIEGGLDAVLLETYLNSWNDPEGFAVSHLGWGLDERANWAGVQMQPQTRGQDCRSLLGNFQFSTGPNTDAGGDRHTPCHVDMPMRNCSLWLDGEQVIDRGEIIPDDMRPAGSGA